MTDVVSRKYPTTKFVERISIGSCRLELEVFNSHKEEGWKVSKSTTALVAMNCNEFTSGAMMNQCRKNKIR